MTQLPILILAYKRTDELRQTIDAAIRLRPSCLYFHVHAAADPHGQELVDEVLRLIESVQYNKKMLYVNSPLGCRNSMLNALSWMHRELGEGQPLIVLEDDIVITATDEEIPGLVATIEALDQKHTHWVYKFGEQCNSDWAVFWGWATNTATALRLASTDILAFAYDEIKDLVSEPLHWEALRILYQQNQSMAWDDEFSFIIRAVGDIQLVKRESALTTHIGTVSTRTDSLDVPFMASHVTFENGIPVTQ